MRIHYLQHVAFEDLAEIESWARARGHAVTATRLFQNEPLPEAIDFDLLVVLGGPMNIYEEDQYPWLAAEKRFIERALGEEKKLLGICLGAQLIADVLGARVVQNRQKEIGWFPVTLTEAAQNQALFAGLPASLTVFHWHGDTFPLPAGATHLARSEACENQAFAYGNKVLGLQFHIESTKASIEKMIRHEAADLTGGAYVQPAETILSEERFFSGNQQALYAILDGFLENQFDR